MTELKTAHPNSSVPCGSDVEGVLLCQEVDGVSQSCLQDITGELHLSSS